MIVPNFDVLRQRKVVNAKEVIRFDIESLSPQLASTKRISSYEIWQDDLPRTTTRKIKRFEVEKRVRANQSRKLSDDSDLPAEKPLSPEESAWLEQPDVQRGLNILHEAARSAPTTMRPTLNLELDLGLDSMQRVEVLSQLEDELGGDLAESQLAEIYTVRDLIDAVLQSAASGAGGSGTRTTFAGWKTILAEDPDDKDVLALAHPHRISDAFWYFVSRLINVIALDKFDLKVSGAEKLPKSGPYILSSNHQSYLDPLVLASILPADVFRRTFAVGTSEIFGKGFMRHLARSIKVVVLDPDANLVPAMRAGAFGLRNGLVLILYPEGERSIDGTPRTFKKGAAILSIHLQVPIVPIAIEGFYEAWPRNKSFQRFAPLKVVIGDPITPPPESDASEQAYEKLTADLKARIVTMWERTAQSRIVETSLRARMRLIVNLQHMLHRKLRISLCGREPFVAKQFLDRPQVRSFLQHVCSKRMSQRVRMHIGRQALGHRNLFDDSSNTSSRQPPPPPVDEQSNGISCASVRVFCRAGIYAASAASPTPRKEHSAPSSLFRE